MARKIKNPIHTMATTMPTAVLASLSELPLVAPSAKSAGPAFVVAVSVVLREMGDVVDGAADSVGA
jgi:hypothetical protein